MKRNQNQKKTHKILMLLIMQQNLSGRVNPKGKLKGAQLEHLHSWIANFTRANSEAKWLKAKETTWD
jgi:hypothetical protein